ALRAVVGRDSLDRQYRHAAVVEPARLCGRSLRLARRVLDLWARRHAGGDRRVRAGAEPARRAQGPLFAAVADDRGAAARPVAPAARPNRASAGVAGDLAGAARPLGRAVADAGQGI